MRTDWRQPILRSISMLWKVGEKFEAIRMNAVAALKIFWIHMSGLGRSGQARKPARTGWVTERIASSGEEARFGIKGTK